MVGRALASSDDPGVKLVRTLVGVPGVGPAASGFPSELAELRERMEDFELLLERQRQLIRDLTARLAER